VSLGRQELNTTVCPVVISCHVRLDAFVVQHVPFLSLKPDFPSFSIPATLCPFLRSRVFSAPSIIYKRGRDTLQRRRRSAC